MPKTNRKTSKLPSLLSFDARVRQGLNPSCSWLIGLDEVGRGSMIGPIVAGAACLPETLDKEQRNLLRWLDDSKKLSAEVRAELCGALITFCHTGIGMAEKDEVDRLNVHHASLLASYRAFEALCGDTLEPGSCYLLVDGRTLLPNYPRERQQAVIKGDGCSAAIAAASVLAKETRDRLIMELAKDYPGYGWETNMGYGTPEHLRGLEKLGITALHRRNYKPVSQQMALQLDT